MILKGAKRLKTWFKLICAVLTAALLTLSFVSCGVITGDTVMEYEGYEITEAMYSYWKSHFKAAFIDAYGTTDKNGAKTLDWDKTLPNGSTYEQFFEDELVNSYAKKVLICQKLFDDYGLELSEDDEQAISDIMTGLESIYGDTKGLNAYLSDYNLNAKTLERIYYAEAKVGIVTDYIFGENGPNRVTTAEKTSYYTANYYCVNWIYIYTSKKPAAASEGNNPDASNILVDMTEEEKAQKKQLVDSIVSKLQSGESFGELKAEYCEDKYSDGTSKYDYLPNGFNLSANDYDSYGVELIRLIQEMQIGDITTYEDKYGTTRIIVRNPLVEYTELTEQEKSIMVDFDTYVREQKWDSIINEADIKFYDKVASRYSAKTAKPFTNLVI